MLVHRDFDRIIFVYVINLTNNVTASFIDNAYSNNVRALINRYVRDLYLNPVHIFFLCAIKIRAALIQYIS